MGPAGYGDRVEGTHAVSAALTAGRVDVLVVERTRAGRSGVAELVERCRESGIPVRTVDDVREMAATTAPQGVVAECRPLVARTLEALAAEEDPAALLVIDHVEDPHNLGAMARSAVAAGIPRLVVPRRRASPLSAAAFKAAAGALEWCGVAFVSSVADAISRLRRLGIWAVGLDAGGRDRLFGLELLSEPVAIVVGGETGLARLVRDRCDVLAAIPMVAGSESLNASVAAALACFEVMRARHPG